MKRDVKVYLLLLGIMLSSLNAFTQCWYYGPVYDRDGDGYCSSDVYTDAAHPTATSIWCSWDIASAIAANPQLGPSGCNTYDCDDWDPSIQYIAGCSGYKMYYVDTDGDGYGSTNGTSSANQPLGFASNNFDCDDSNANIHPGANEACDGIDNNCDGIIDGSQYYADADGDGAGDPTSTPESVLCGNSPTCTGCVSNNYDQDDNDASDHPCLPEVCNDGIDNDCDGIIDNGCGGGGNDSTDDDGDGYREIDGDCDDADISIHPGAVDILCNGIDEDCNGSDAVSTTLYYQDNDGDGWGGTSLGTTCNPPNGAITVGGDFDDGCATCYPGAQEVCDGNLDNDGNGFYDDNDPNVSNQTTWWRDNDTDGYGDALAATQDAIHSCTQPSGYTDNNYDFNDNNQTIYPGALELCDGFDNDGNGIVDEGLAQFIYYADTDADGFGDANNATLDCAMPSGYVTDNTDCNDSDPSIFPGTTETCNNVDDNCNGLIDEITAVATGNIAKKKVELSWSAVNGASGYRLRYKQTSTTTWTVRNIGMNSVKINGLTSNTSYHWQVRARCGNGPSATLGNFTPLTSFTTALRLASNIEEENSLMSENFAFPNPSKDVLNIQFIEESDSPCSIQLINVTGKVVLKHNVITDEGINNFKLDVSKIDSGIYFLKVNTTNEILKTKIVIE